MCQASESWPCKTLANPANSFVTFHELRLSPRIVLPELNPSLWREPQPNSPLAKHHSSRSLHRWAGCIPEATPPARPKRLVRPPLAGEGRPISSKAGSSTPSSPDIPYADIHVCRCVSRARPGSSFTTTAKYPCSCRSPFLSISTQRRAPCRAKRTRMCASRISATLQHALWGDPLLQTKFIDPCLEQHGWPHILSAWQKTKREWYTRHC